MGYELKIGQALTRFDSEMGRERVDCEKVYLADAPAFGEITDHSSVRLPSYSSWEDFAEEVGLYEFFYDRDQGLLNESDGVFPLTWVHMAAINQAFTAYLERHPSVFSVKSDDSLSAEDFHFERLRWLKFWIEWALESCDTPVFLNYQ